MTLCQLRPPCQWLSNGLGLGKSQHPQQGCHSLAHYGDGRWAVQQRLQRLAVTTEVVAHHWPMR